MKNITHIFFDLDHTLWDTDRNSEESLSELYQEYKLENLGIPSFEKFLETYKRHNQRLWGLYAENQVGKNVVRLHRFQHTFQDFSIHDIEISSVLADAFIERTPKKQHLIEGAKLLLEHLYGKYKLAIITNGFRESQHTKMELSGLSKYFDQVYISEEVGIHKPDPAIFYHAAEKSGAASTSDCMMVGDTYQTDVMGAIAAGMHAIHYSPESIQDHPAPVITVKKLEDIQTYF
ncbi:YjjG family noncanonical pyrimidine nucleotidase [soil metagenome]